MRQNTMIPTLEQDTIVVDLIIYSSYLNKFF